LFRSIWKDFKTRFQHILDDLRSYKALIESQANLLQIQDTQAERVKIQDSFARIQEAERKNQFIILMNWLSYANPFQDQEGSAAMRKDYPTTGQWVLDEAQVKGWLDASNIVAPVLWVHGIPGAGENM
jgi:hypothetical protein